MTLFDPASYCAFNREQSLFFRELTENVQVSGEKTECKIDSVIIYSIIYSELVDSIRFNV